MPSQCACDYFLQLPLTTGAESQFHKAMIPLRNGSSYNRSEHLDKKRSIRLGACNRASSRRVERGINLTARRSGMLSKRICTLSTLSLSLLFSGVTMAQSDLPRASKQTILDAFQGAFKIEHSNSVSETAWSEGRIAYNPANDSVFIESHVYDLAIGEFKIPQNLSTSSNKSALPSAQVLQSFTNVLNRAPTGRGSSDRIGGMAVIDGKLFVQGYVTYDASGSVRDTTVVVDNPGNLSQSSVRGFFRMDGAARVVNYLSPVPPEWQSELGGNSWIAGNGSGMSIASRLSNGPSLYSFEPDDFGSSSSGSIDTLEYMDYPVEHPLSTEVITDTSFGYYDWDAFNVTLQNDMWTELSSAWYGFIIPGTRTFAVIGSSGMHESGGGYKIVNSAGFECYGPCAKDNTDEHSFYWLFDMNEILDASLPWKPLPYEYGVFDDRFVGYNQQGAVGVPTGGAFDIESGTLVISHGGGTSNNGGGSPIVSVFKFDGVEITPPLAAPAAPVVNLRILPDE